MTHDGNQQLTDSQGSRECLCFFMPTRGDISRVEQKHPWGCGVAALAMVTGEDYDAIAEEFGLDFETTGLATPHIDQFLVERGWWMARKYVSYMKKERRTWPPEPFASVHIAQVHIVERRSHFTVMNKFGVCFDPLDASKKALTDYLQVSNVTGLVPPPMKASA